MTDRFGMPGPGGSLGTCAVCGMSFVVESLMGKNVKTFRVGFIDAELYAHDKCEDTIREAFSIAMKSPEGDEQAAALRDALPEESPIRTSLDKYLKEKAA